MSDEEKRVRFEALLQFDIPCVIFCRDLQPGPILLELAEKHGVPILGTGRSTSEFMAELIYALGEQLAPCVTIHGVLVDVYGEGLMITGDSGIGKSEAALELIRRSGCLIAAPSANTSGRPSPTEAAHVVEDMNGRIAMILDGGPVRIGIESTIIDLTEPVPMVLRPGYITPKMLSEVLGQEVILDPGIIAADDTRKPKAPGMKYRHYAPKAQMVVVDGKEQAVVTKINELVKGKRDRGEKVAVIATEETRSCYEADIVLCIGRRTDEDAIAQHLYRIWRECDDLDVAAIYSECFQTPRIGQAIMNRLLKAAGHMIIEV